MAHPGDKDTGGKNIGVEGWEFICMNSNWR